VSALGAAVALAGLASCTGAEPTTEGPTVSAGVGVGASVIRSIGEPAVTRAPALTPPLRRTAPAARVTAPKPAATQAAAPAQTAATAVRRTRTHAVATVSGYVTGCDGTSGWVQRRGAYALRRISYSWKPLGYSLVFLPARSGISGMTYPEQRRIEVYVRSCSRMTVAYLAETIAHEIGHAVDFTRGTDSWHRQWQVARHISLSIPWYGTPYATDFSTPAGDFAETFAAWQVPDGPNDSKWGRPTAAQMRLLVPLMTI
jgi:hypothetical protein